ncbi:hypothetical protein EMIHUDRAFT_242159 [Emiliania huxleyi CCMP1516]|uniref:Tyrosinase copper-binding domain-containing protein n=2 Tax=Emiliania huxleyi TaxID=2903 RepID=A0A0D3J9U9_EMIH1|nr:hypothetical protein EMIHUDRAFT_242159 [Emiliania huxleyi CCMP1516]EOD20284.1 hypothetical protein EMIHUDRAFT_242159 [Emiliania huxleyi CCMP1516]|eukprot:XP_005772713.1 hypothetical protein EMIHUDRAFT_242159 [Emiliania huxleyi CCMP1516]
MTLTVSVWDSDRGQDDPLGSATFELQLENGVRTMTLPLEHVPGGRESTVTFTSRVELPLRPSPEPEAEAVTEAVTAGPVTRKEIRMMSPEEQQRYAAAVKKMMENTSGPESSEFFRLAGYHGWPGNGAERNYSYCEHRQETFPGWHRAYLIAFEQSLRDADRALGNDGHIGLPYWDVLARPELNGQVVPSIVKEHFGNGTAVPRALLDESLPPGGAAHQRKRLWDEGYAIADDADLKRTIESQRLPEKIGDALWIRQHYRAASTYGTSSRDSVETPHDLIHVLSGFPMKRTWRTTQIPNANLKAIPPPVLKGGGPSFAPSNDFEDEDHEVDDTPTFPPGSTVTYAVEEAPGYLNRGMLLNEVAQCFAAWAGPTASGLEFERLPAERADDAQLVIGWADHSKVNQKKFDGPGGHLAEANASSIVFDSAERWLLHGVGWEKLARSEEPKGAPPSFYLAPVLLHEIGHTLGLTHSHTPTEVMAPHYAADKVSLAPGDKSRARLAYSVPEPDESNLTPPPEPALPA